MATGRPKRPPTRQTREKQTPEKRRRLSADEARERILEAAEKRLHEVGAVGLRLQEIARDVGLSHPTVLHHFGSREALVDAVLERSLTHLEREIVACFTAGGLGATDVQSTLERVDDTMRLRGQARLLAWLALTYPEGLASKQSNLRDVARVIHAARNATSKRDIPFEDTTFNVLLAAAAMFGTAIIGRGLLEMMDVTPSEELFTRFRAWFTDLLIEHAEIPRMPER